MDKNIKNNNNVNEEKEDILEDIIGDEDSQIVDIDTINELDWAKNRDVKVIVGGILSLSVLGNIFLMNKTSELSSTLDETVDTLELASEELDKQSSLIEEQKTVIEDRESSIEAKTKEIDSLKAKVQEAEPWFKMGEEQQKLIEQENERLEKERLAKEEAERIAKEKAELEARTKTFSSGNYVAGEDFDEGTYDIIAVKGHGNVSSDNMFSGGLNAIMGVSGGSFYEKEYKNIKLPKGTTLTVSGVTIKIVPKN